MDDFRQLLRITPVADVQKKWRVTDDRFEEIVKTQSLPVYTIRERRIRPDDGRTVYFCDGPRFYLLRGADLLDYAPLDCERGGLVLEGECFNSDDIETYETKYPELLWTPAPEDGKDGDEFIPADVVRKQLGMSPAQFVDHLRKNHDLCFFGIYENDRKWFYNGASREQAAEMLDDLSIHRLDIDHHCAMPTADEEMPTVERSQGEHRMNNEAQLAEAQEKIKSLHTWSKHLNEQNKKLSDELAEKKGQIAALEANAELDTTTRTQSATEARQEKNLSIWQAAFKIMIPVILQCHTNGPRGLTRDDLQSMCSKHGGKITKTQCNFLRKCLMECLGSEHINMDGGPSSQSRPPSDNVGSRV